MNQPLKILCVSILTILAVAVSANAYYNDCSSVGAWNATGGAIVSNQMLFTPNGENLYIPASSTVSNGLPASGQKVWTDFLTRPRRYQSLLGVAPADDPTATAQFYVNSSGYWTTISREGTQTWTSVLGGSAYTPVNEDSTAYYHVSVLNNYSNSTWSLFVDGLPLATNLTSLATRASGVTGHKWFKVENSGYQATSVCWLDNFEVTNRMPLAGSQTAGGQPLTNNVIPGTDIPEALAFAGFGSFADPRPVNTNATTTSSSATFKFSGAVPGSGSSYTVLKSGSATNGFVAAGGPIFNPDTGIFTGTDIGGSVSKYFYRLVRVSDDKSVSVTNIETYAVYKQGRIPGTTYIVGVPVDYVGNDRTLGGPLGTQLATGLSDGDKLTVYPGQITYTLTSEGTYWSGERPLSSLTRGMGVMIEHSNGSSPSSTILAGILQTNTSIGAIALNHGWNIVAWPYETPGSLASFTSGLTASDTAGADYIVFQNVTNATTIARLTVSDGWKTGTRPGSGSVFHPSLQPGAGIMLYLHGNAGEWSP